MKQWTKCERVVARRKDPPRDAAVDIAKRLETGTVWINQNLQNGPHIPFSGAKQSGLGVENGTAGLLEFTQAKTIFIPKAGPAP